jgi:hypothetical protein
VLLLLIRDGKTAEQKKIVEENRKDFKNKQNILLELMILKCNGKGMKCSWKRQ